MSFNFPATVTISRPQNLLILVVAVVTGAFAAGSLQPYDKLALACFSALFIMAGGNAVNDYFDVEIDRVNKPFRPLPAGRLTLNFVRNFFIISFVLGIFLSIFISNISVFLAVVATFFLIIYSARLKRTVLIGNITVSLVTALAFVYGGAAVGRIQGTLIPAGFAFLFHLGREILKDIEDREADGVVAAQTLPVRFGTSNALRVASAVFLVLIVFSIWPYWAGIYGIRYLIVVVIGVDLLLFILMIVMWRSPDPRTLRWISAILKVDMFVGLAAVIVGAR